jgi:hypothetical protein
MRRLPGPPPPHGPRALLDYNDNELRPALRYIRRVDRLVAASYVFTFSVNAMGVVIVDRWWRWVCLVIAIGMALALRFHIRKMRANARGWREFQANIEELRRRVTEEEEGDMPSATR